MQGLKRNNKMWSREIEKGEMHCNMLLDKIRKNITNFVITDSKGLKPVVIHSKNAGMAAV